MSDSQAPFEATLVFPVWQWQHEHALEWVADLSKKLQRTTVVAHGGGGVCPPPTVVVLRRNPEFRNEM